MSRRHARWLLGPLTTCFGLCWATESAAPLAGTVHRFNLPAQDAIRALQQIATELGVAILAAQEDLSGVRTHAVAGSLSLDETLTRLLAGTGLAFSYTADGRSVLWKRVATPAPPRAASPPIAVQEHGPAQLAAIVVTAQRRPQDLQQVPVSVVVLGGEQLTRQRLDFYYELSQVLPSFVDGQNSRGGNRFIRASASSRGNS
jgi:hypothetical protein